MPVKISKQLERSNCSLLSADNSIPEESEDEEEDIEEERIGKLGEEETTSTSSFMEGEEGKRTSPGGELAEARTSQSQIYMLKLIENLTNFLTSWFADLIIVLFANCG